MKKLVAIFIIIFSCQLWAQDEPPAQAYVPEIDFQTEYNTISLNILEKNYEQALQNARLLLFITQNAQLYQLYGICNQLLERDKITYIAFNQIVNYSDLSPAMISQVSNYFINKDEQNKAIALYEKGIKIFPDNLGLYSSLGDLYFKTKKYTKNIAMFEKLLSRIPELSNPVSYYLGVSYYATDQDDKAFKAFTDAADNGVIALDLYIKLGDLNAKRKNYRTALDFYLKAEAEDVKEASMFNNMGYCYYKLNNKDKALEYFTKAGNAGYKSEDFFQNYATIAFELKSYEDLLQTIEPVYDSIEDKKDIAYYLGRTYDIMRENEKAIYYYQQALDNNYDDSNDTLADRIDDLSE